MSTASAPGHAPGRASVWRRLRKRPGSTAAMTCLVLVVGMALCAPALPLPAPFALQPAEAGHAPTVSWGEAHQPSLEQLAEDHGLSIAFRRTVFGTGELAGLMGTDALGRDVAARLVWGARISLMVGLVATLVSVLIGVGWGLLAGYMGGRTDGFMMRTVDVLYSVPFLFVVILVIAMLRELSAPLREYGIDRLVILYVVIGAISWLTMARIVRGQVLSLRSRDFITAARALGAGRTRILVKHLLPNLWGLIIVYLTLTVPRVMLFEAFLSFLGLGVEPPGVSWGILASEGLESLTPVSITWWLIVFPGAALVLTLSSLNTIGDALRDALDPRLANR